MSFKKRLHYYSIYYLPRKGVLFRTPVHCWESLYENSELGTILVLSFVANHLCE